MHQNPNEQQTIAQPVTVRGRGLFGGAQASVTFKPGAPDSGVVFIRTDLGGAQVPARIANVVKRARRSALRAGEAMVETCEHVFSAVAGLGLDNLVIELDAPELPDLDGSAKPFVEALRSAGFQSCGQMRRGLVISGPVMVRLDDMTLAALPSVNPGLEIVYELDYSGEPAIGRQVGVFRLGVDDYAQEIAPARTFVLEAEAAALQESGVGRHLTAAQVLVIGKKGPVSPNQFRFADEPVRHKLLDLIGDLALFGAPIQGRLIAVRSGHALNHALVRELEKQLRAQVHRVLATVRPALDVRKLAEILPHRYPMLLVDRVIEIDGDRRVLGIKNVTMNEPFFTGHFPGTPIMPGVLIVEAMAQLSGILLGQKFVNQGKIAILMSLDRVKIRRPVVPGDQLMLEAESVRVRSTIAHTRCRAYVGEDIAAEAEIKFMIVAADQV